MKHRFSYRSRVGAALASALRWLALRPELSLTAAAAPFYFYQLRHLPGLFWIALLLAPVLVLHYFAILLARRILAARMQRASISPWPELAIAFVLSVMLILLEDALRGWFALLPVILLAYLALAARLRRPGAFYTAFTGLLLLCLTLFSYRLLYVEERALVFARYHLARLQAVELLQDRVRWEATQVEAPGGERLAAQQLIVEDEAWLTVPAPEDFVFHDGRTLSFAYGAPEPGAALAYVSRRREDPFAPPAFGVFLLERNGSGAEETGPPDAEAYKDDFVLALGHRRNAGEIDSVVFEGMQELDGEPRAWSGFSYRYRDLVFEQNERLRFLVTRDGERVYGVLLHEPIQPGFGIHPDLALLLEGLRFSGSGADSNSEPEAD